jgi:hypothetical protein
MKRIWFNGGNVDDYALGDGFLELTYDDMSDSEYREEVKYAVICTFLENFFPDEYESEEYAVNLWMDTAYFELSVGMSDRVMVYGNFV